MMRGFRVRILLITFTLCMLSSTVTGLTFHNNKYEGLVIAIHPDVKEDLTILTEIQRMLELGSKYLYHATKKRAYLGSAKILVPETWTYNSSWQLATTEIFKEADIRVDKPHVSHGTDPYTFQPGLCGEPGKYTHFTPEFLTMSEQNRDSNYGDIGRIWVHEFAHFRYGIFDEYGIGTEEYPYVYLDDGTIFPTGCSDTIQTGHYVGDCTVASNNTVAKTCYFLPDRRGNTAKASIMYDTTLDQVTAFCESNSDDPDHVHNPLAKNQQNKVCDERGTWDVIIEHADFKNGNSPVNVSDSSLRPTVEILSVRKAKTANGARVCGRTLVLVLDYSGSMYPGRMFKQKQMVDKLIMDILPVGTRVGIVTFANNAFERVPLTSLDTKAVRTEVMKQLQAVDQTGGTGIGNGLLEAKQLLEAAGELNKGRILLITDGEETDRPYVADVQGKIIRAGIRMHTVAYSSNAATAISSLSKASGGQYAFYSESETSTALDSIIESLMKDISTCSNEVRIEVLRKAENVAANIKQSGTVTIDSTVTNNTMFVFTLPSGTSVDVTLTDPKGTVYSKASNEFSLDTILNIARFIFPTAEIGTWSYALTSPQGGIISIVVKSVPGVDDDPYEVDSWISDISAGPNSEPTRVYVHVHKGYSPVMHADVYVTVERPNPPSVILKPRDDGKLPDTLANDGIYTTYFTQFSGNARYSLDVGVKTIPGKTTFYNVTGSPTYGGAMSRYHNTTKPPVVVLTENFTRSGSPGAMDVSGYVPGEDTYPPGRVTDLQVVAFDTDKRTVSLTWTAPGGDLNQGTAARYDLRLGQSADVLRNNFPKSTEVTPGMVLSGTLSPHMAGTLERMVVQTPRHWTTVALALQTYDAGNLASKRSNIAVASFTDVALAGQPSTSPTTDKNDAFLQPVSEAGDSPLLIIGIVGGSIIGVMITVAVAAHVIAKLICKSKVRSMKDPDHDKVTKAPAPEYSV